MKELKVISLYFFLIVNLFSGLHVEAKSIVSGDIVEGQQYVPSFLKQKGHFEKNANGTSAYADAAGTRPVDGSGGAPTLSCTRTTSSPIDGDGSLLITKDAANRQGQGCTIQFTIDSAYKAKVLQIEFDYLVASGTFTAGSSSADSDLIVYIYDVTNSTLIEPSSIKLLSNSSTISDHFVANFQTSATGTTYNLIIHQATTSASAYTVKADNFVVKPSQYVYGTPISDWVSYSLTIGGSTSAPTVGTNTSRAIWRRVGDSMEIKYYLNQTGAGAAGSGTYLFPLPSGSTIDTNKATVTTNGSGLGGTALGSATAGNTTSSSSNNATVGTVIAYNSTNLAVQLLATTIGQTITLGSTNYALSGATILYQFEASVPISGWSSSTQVSDGYDGRQIGAKVQRITSDQSIANNTETKVQFNSVIDDKTGSFDAVTNYRFTAPSSGDYEFTGYLAMQGTAGTGAAYAVLYKNGAGEAYSHIGKNGTGTATWGIPLNFKSENVKAGDYFEIYVLQATGGSLNLISAVSVTQGSVLNIKKLQSPTTISATEVVSFRGYIASNQALTADTTNLPLTAIKDSHGVWTGSTYPAPYAGDYMVCASIINSATSGTYHVYVNGSRQNGYALFTADTTTFKSGCTSVTNVLSGQTISIRSNASVTALGDAGTSVTIYRIK